MTHGKQLAVHFGRKAFSTLGLIWCLACFAGGGFLLYKGATDSGSCAGAPTVQLTDSISSKDNTKNIEDVKVGDYVLAKNLDDPGPPTPHKVLAVIQSESLHVVHVGVSQSSDSTADGEIQATQFHPFWVRGQGWTFAKDLKTGDDLEDVSGHAVAVTSIRIEQRDVKTYNLSIEGVHTFYVATGNASILVHNAPFGNVPGGGPIPADQALENATQYLGPGYREIAPGVSRSADNLRQFRMTTSDLTDPTQGPHVHYESVGPDGRTITENSHVQLCP
jgi:hypothetical protein